MSIQHGESKAEMTLFRVTMRDSWSNEESSATVYGDEEHEALERLGILPEQGSDYQVSTITPVETDEGFAEWLSRKMAP